MMRYKHFAISWLMLLALAVQAFAGDVYWEPTAAAVPQKTTITLTGVWADTETITITCNNKSVIITTGPITTSITDVAAAVTAAINSNDTSTTELNLIGDETKNIGGQQFPEFREFVATYAGGVITLTGNTDGAPFTVTATETAAGGAIGSVTITQAATGPNHYNNVNNWDTGVVPISGDDVYVTEGGTSILYWGTTDPNSPQSFTVGPGYSGSIGLPLRNASYREYRPRFLPIEFDTAADVYRIEGGARVQLDTKAVAGTIFVTRGNVSLVSTGTITLNALGGSVETGDNGATACKLGAVTVGDEEGKSASVVMSSSTTFAAGLPITVYSGSVVLDAAHADEKIIYKGNLTVNSGAQATITLRGGGLVYNGIGTLTTLTEWAGGADFSQDIRTKTVTNLNMYKGTYYWDPLGKVTLTNGIDLEDCGLHEVEIKSPKALTWTATGL